VTSRGDATGWWQKIRLNRGSSHGVAKDMAVISTSGLVGRTLSVSRFTSDVLLVTDPGSRVACKFAGTEAFGIVTGTGVAVDEQRALEMLYAVKPARMDYIPRDPSLIAGADIVTSGLGGVYPEGLLLGRVTAIVEQPHKLYRQADVVPSADMSSLRYVFVVLE
jgi:rod shape-determining protein MreC